ncbi:hypothetical protein ACIA47_16015 [Micromonospora sp. NPDC051227]|uniref:hypothetical protein n=1 Tax=Micromonospora sp. NPDC051227 TaxID=3364285 RepID=UPI0019342173|nr:hypothetical protein [Micromonospora sp. STR1s_5]
MSGHLAATGAALCRRDAAAAAEALRRLRDMDRLLAAAPSLAQHLTALQRRSRPSRPPIADHETDLHELGVVVSTLAAAVTRLQRPLTAVGQAGRAARHNLDLPGTVVMTQVRTIASNPLRASGIDRSDPNRLVRDASR